MRVFILVAVLALAPVPGQASELTVQDVKMLLAMTGINPGTIRQLGSKGLHKLLAVRVTGRKGHWKILIHEREVK